MNIKFINYVENRLTKSYYPRLEYAIETKRNAQFFICVCCVCCECLCCCYCFCCCTFCSCWHIDSGIRKNACTTRIHSETRYSHGALTGELDQIEVLPPFSFHFLSSSPYTLLCCVAVPVSKRVDRRGLRYWTCAHSTMRSSRDSTAQTVLSSQLHLDLAFTCSA